MALLLNRVYHIRKLHFSIEEITRHGYSFGTVSQSTIEDDTLCIYLGVKASYR
jgi:hypothetical protein